MNSLAYCDQWIIHAAGPGLLRTRVPVSHKSDRNERTRNRQESSATAGRALTLPLDSEVQRSLDEDG